jgi:DNA (cytosine-5)-methyltransferase 1
MPCPTVSTKDRFTKVEAQFIQSYFSGGGQLGSIEQPNPTITGVPKQRLTTINFMDQQYGMSKPASIEDPAGTITSNPKLNLISADRFLLNPQYANKGGSLDKPCFTLIARMDKMPPYIVSASSGKIFAVPIFERECETMQKIRMFMAVYGIIDIKMRMLVIDELLRIQGFPDGYHLEGTQTEQKKFIGNAVVPVVAKALVQSNSKAIEMYLNKIAV